jgi:hypothetical protein
VNKKGVNVMRTKTTFACLFALLIISCGKSPESGEKSAIAEKQAVEIPSEPLENVLTLEVSIGSTELPDEFLLANPLSLLAVNSKNSDIIIADERRFKIFDENGNPKLILGGPGQGPGEYSWPRPHIVGDYLTGIDRLGNVTARYHLYTLDYEYIETRLPRQNKFHSPMMKEHPEWSGMFYYSFYHYAPDERYIFAQTYSRNTIDGFRDNGWAGIYQTADKSEVKFLLKDMPYNGTHYLVGRVWSLPLNSKKVAYVDPYHDVKHTGDKHYYYIGIYDLESDSLFKIEYEFDPVAFPDSIKSKETTLYTPDGPRVNKKRLNFLSKLKYCAPVKRITIDGDIIYAFLNKSDKEKGWLVDVFDGAKGKYLNSAWFPFVARKIFDGYAYRIENNEAGFRVVNKYRINPAVYGK